MDKLGAWDLQIQTTIYKINNKVLLYGTGNYIQYLIIIYNGKEYNGITLLYQKLTQHCKSKILQ